MKLRGKLNKLAPQVGEKVLLPPTTPPPPPEGALPKVAYTSRVRPTAYIFSGFRYMKSGNSLIQEYRKGGGGIKSFVSVRKRTQNLTKTLILGCKKDEKNFWFSELFIE